MSGITTAASAAAPLTADQQTLLTNFLAVLGNSTAVTQIEAAMTKAGLLQSPGALPHAGPINANDRILISQVAAGSSPMATTTVGTLQAAAVAAAEAAVSKVVATASTAKGS